MIYTGNITEDEKYFNRLHQKIRNIIERCIGLLKGRFRCLLAERVLHYHPTKASRFVNTCAILHNYLICNNYDVQRDMNEDEFENVVDEDVEENEPILAYRELGVAIRNELRDYLLLQRI